MCWASWNNFWRVIGDVTRCGVEFPWTALVVTAVYDQCREFDEAGEVGAVLGFSEQGCPFLT